VFHHETVFFYFYFSATTPSGSRPPHLRGF